MFHVEQETTSIFKNSLPFVRLYTILTIVCENGKFGIPTSLLLGKNTAILKKRKQLPEIWQLLVVPREF